MSDPRCFKICNLQKMVVLTTCNLYAIIAGHATGDTFVKKEHSEKLHEKYAGDKNIIT